MSSHKIIRNKISNQAPPVCELSTDDRLRLIANVTIDCIQAEVNDTTKAEDEKHD